MPDLLNYHKSDLDHIMAPRQLALFRIVADAAVTRHMPLYLVGGFVRDLLLGIPATDFDLVVEGDAISLARTLAAQHGGRVTSHLRFGTAQWFLDDTGQHALDFISARSEHYNKPAVLPMVKPGTLTDDLVRRDFTINTLALRLDGEHWGYLRDDLGGLDDLRRGLIQILHPRSFQDDPTRIFRAVRYEQRYDFKIVPQTLSLMAAAYPLINLLSAQRLRHELDLVLEEEKAVCMISRLAELNFLQVVHPSLSWNDATRERFLNGFHLFPEHHFKSIPYSASKSFLGWHFWLMDLAPNDLESLERRLHFRANLFTSILAASTLYLDLSSYVGLKPSQVVRRLEKMPLTAVYAVFLATPDGTAQQVLFNYLENWRHVKPKTDGHDLKRRGLPEGPLYQRILERLREAWLDEEVQTERDEIEALEKLINIV